MPYCPHFDEDIIAGVCAICAQPKRRRTAADAVRGRGGSTSGGVASAYFDTGTVELETPYDEDFVEDLKAALPARARSWNRDRRVWIIAGEYWDAAVEVVEQYFDLVD
jgi:hypothetical protein